MCPDLFFAIKKLDISARALYYYLFTLAHLSLCCILNSCSPEIAISSTTGGADKSGLIRRFQLFETSTFLKSGVAVDTRSCLHSHSLKFSRYVEAFAVIVSDYIANNVWESRRIRRGSPWCRWVPLSHCLSDHVLQFWMVWNGKGIRGGLIPRTNWWY